MGEAVDRTGTFRAEVISYGMKKYDSGSIAVNLVFRLTDWWYVPDEGEPGWTEWGNYGQEVFGSFFVVKKTGDLNQGPIQQLVEHVGWNGNFDSITDGTWEPTPCQVQVKSEVYDGSEQMKASWIYSYDAVPRSGLAVLSAEESKSLNAKYGGQIRAIVGDKIRQDTKPKRPPPPAPKAAEADDIPF